MKLFRESLSEYSLSALDFIRPLVSSHGFPQTSSSRSNVASCHGSNGGVGVGEGGGGVGQY